MHRFTAEFGMGSGGSNALWSSRNSVARMSRWTAQRIRICDVVLRLICGLTNFRVFRLHHRNLRQQIAWVLYGQASRAISIG